MKSLQWWFEVVSTVCITHLILDIRRVMPSREWKHHVHDNTYSTDLMWRMCKENGSPHSVGAPSKFSISSNQFIILMDYCRWADVSSTIIFHHLQWFRKSQKIQDPLEERHLTHTLARPCRHSPIQFPLASVVIIRSSQWVCVFSDDFGEYLKIVHTPTELWQT